jgi:hypothetical protein
MAGVRGLTMVPMLQCQKIPREGIMQRRFFQTGSHLISRRSGQLGVFILGALAGTVLGVLFAPTQGSSTRNYLRRRARDGRIATIEAWRRRRHPRSHQGIGAEQRLEGSRLEA